MRCATRSILGEPVVGELLWVDRLTAEVPGPGRALDDVSFAMAAGETVAIVGESGSGKTLLGRLVADVAPTTVRVVTGDVHWRGQARSALSARARRNHRGADIAYIPQDIGTALDPSRRIGASVVEGLRRVDRMRRGDASARALELLRTAGFDTPEQFVRAYPHQVSLGQRQRALIATALAREPRLVVADEPTSALDAPVAAEVIETLRRIRNERDSALLLITHDLGAVAALADRVLVLYAGRIVETAPVSTFFRAPAHPYTRALLAARPEPGARPSALPGTAADIRALPSGCAFHPRCPNAVDSCTRNVPLPRELERGHVIACPIVEGAR